MIMKAIIGTGFIRKSNNILLNPGVVIEDFTEEELKQYSGLYRIEEETKKEVKTEIKSKKNKQ